MIIRRARVTDYPAVWALLTDSRDWLRRRGLDQWAQTSRWPDKLAASLARGDVWLVYSGGDPVATVTVETVGDPDFWTAGELAVPALYLSKMAVRRNRAGQGIGADILRWAADRAYRRGARWVRLDAWKTNTGLHDYYRGQGWGFVRFADVPRRRSGALFQLPARPTAHRIEEVPAMTVLPTTRIAGPEGGDPAGNYQPGHMHRSRVLIHSGDRSDGSAAQEAILLPGYRYRIVEDTRTLMHEWVLEGSPVGAAWWERHGRIVIAGFPLMPGRVYVISHGVWGAACRMVIESVVATVNAGGRLPAPKPAPADAA